MRLSSAHSCGRGWEGEGGEGVERAGGRAGRVERRRAGGAGGEASHPQLEELGAHRARAAADVGTHLQQHRVRPIAQRDGGVAAAAQPRRARVGVGDHPAQQPHDVREEAVGGEGLERVGRMGEGVDEAGEADAGVLEHPLVVVGQ